MNTDNDAKRIEDNIGKKPCWICLDQGATRWGGQRPKKCRCGTEWISIGGKEIMKHDKESILERTQKMLGVGFKEGTLTQLLTSISTFLSNSDPYGNPDILIEEESSKSQSILKKFVLKTRFHELDISIILEQIEPYYFHHFFYPRVDYYIVKGVCEEFQNGDV